MSRVVGGAWRKSSFSGSGNCVEACFDGWTIRVRDTKDRAGGTLAFSRAEWEAFVDGVKHGEFDPPEPERSQ